MGPAKESARRWLTNSAIASAGCGAPAVAQPQVLASTSESLAAVAALRNKLTQGRWMVSREPTTCHMAAWLLDSFEL